MVTDKSAQGWLQQKLCVKLGVLKLGLGKNV